MTRFCKIADEDHKKSLRQYAHTMHKDGIICIARAYTKLPFVHQMGLMAHEFGHLLNQHFEHTEQEADRAANKYLGVEILYRDSNYGKRLQYLSEKHAMKVYKRLFNGA